MILVDESGILEREMLTALMVNMVLQIIPGEQWWFRFMLPARWNKRLAMTA